jgi:hypothetical protein
MSRYANLYLYFLVFAVEKTKDDGLAVLVVPADWTARPSGVEVMNWLRRLGCKIDIYRIKDTNRFFSDVLTTETILVIDKTAGTFSVNWWSLDADLKARRSTGRSLDKLLPSEARGASYAFRGLSPGGQDVFVLTEGERLAKGIPRKAVVPAITSLRQLPQQGVQLTDASFTKNYVRAGRRCWLLNTAGVVDPAVLQHLSKAPKAVRQNYTCSVRKPWYKYGMPRAPDIVYASGFNGEEPKFFLNSAGVRVVGGVHGIVLAPGSIGRQVVSKLRSTRFRGKVVVHAKGLEKIEVRQMNAVLRAIA